MTNRLLAPALLLLVAAPAFSQSIPERPEALKFPEFSFTAPLAKDFKSTLKAGPAVFLAEDRELPLVTVAVTLKGGTYLDPKGKEGLSSLVGYLLTKGGTKSRKARDLDEELAFLAANLNSSIDDDRGGVTINFMSKDMDTAFMLLREVLTEPAFEEEKLKLRKDQLLSDMKSRNDDSAAIEARERNVIAYGADFYLNRFTTKASIESLTREDLVAFHAKWFDPRNMMVAVSGDFAKADMLKRLEALFSKWPVKGELAPGVPKPSHKLVPGSYIVDKDVNQGRVTILLPGLDRNDPDVFAAAVMNQVLGGGGFTSRITNRVRSDEGLAYSAGSVLPQGAWYPQPMAAFFQSKVRTVAFASQIVLEEMKKMKDGEVTAEELKTVKTNLLETFPRRFATKQQIVGTFLDEEFTGRAKTDPLYYTNWRGNVEKVTTADVKRTAARLLAPDAVTLVVVGKKADILNPDPKHPVALASLTGGKLTEVPLRDPFTMLPMAPAPSAPPPPPTVSNPTPR
ncbi:MAG: insulinase family protein [Acidobacteria bacterium]|nr:insulinase family protein [Acidobacteriota bacterium]